MAALTLLQQLRQRNDQREREMFALQEQRRQEALAQQEQARRETIARQEQAANHGISLLQSGAKLKDVEVAVGGDVSEQGRALWRIIDTTRKRKEQEAKAQQESGALGGTLADFYNKSAQTGVPIPPGLDDDLRFRAHVASLESGGQGVTDQADLLQRIAYQNAAFSQTAGAQAAEQKFRDAMRLERGKANIGLAVDETKRGRDLRDKVAEERRQAALKFYTAQYQDSLIAENGPSDPKAQDALLERAASDPTLGEFAPANVALIQLNALSNARSAQDAMTVARNIEKNTGVRIPLRIGQQIVDGNAIEEPTTGLPFRMPGDKNTARVGMLRSALDAMARIEFYGKKIASRGIMGNQGTQMGGLLNRLSVSASTSGLMRAAGIGSDDEDINAYDAAASDFILAMTYINTGAASNMEEQRNVRSQLPKLAELQRDPRTGGLTIGPRRRLDSAMRGFLEKTISGSLVDAKVTKQKFISAYQGILSELDQNESAGVEVPELLRRLPGGSSPQAQGIQIPGARIRTGP
jgi:hypothetical protein